MTQREARLSRAILNAIRQEGAFAWKVWGGDMQMSGLPDIVGCINSRFIGIETKLPTSRENVSPKQAWVHERMRQAGAAVKVCCSVNEALAFVREVSITPLD